ncbi:MAG: DUF4123 domain-containing protein [Betaproteobacteria bacterium]
MTSFDTLWRDWRQSGAAAPYVLINCAGLERGADQLHEAGFERLECLFLGDLAEELRDVAPYLAWSSRMDDAAASVVRHLSLQQVAILAELRDANATFEQIHRHLRKFNIVYGADGNPLYFRYADARVLPQVLATFSAEQLEEFLGPMQALYTTTPDGETARIDRSAAADRGGAARPMGADAGA